MNLRLNSLFFDITPTYKVELAGYGGRSQLFENIDTSLEVNIILLDEIIFISIDTLFIPDRLREDLVDKLGIDQKKLFICATHTHFAPALDKTKLGLGNPDEQYYEFLVAKIIDAINHIKCKNVSKVEISYGKSEAYHSINRRLKIDEKVFFKPNYQGIKNETVSTIVFKSNRKIKAVIVNYACHPTSSINKTSINADYIHFIREAVRKEYDNKNLPVLFFQGFSGDTRPCCIKRNSSAFYDFTEDEYSSWISSLSNVLKSSFKNLQEIDINAMTIKLNELEYDEIIDSDSYKGILYFHKIIFGNIFLCGVSAEVVTEYSYYIKEKYKNFIVIPISCANGMFGYIPTDEMIEDGGYESDEFFKIFGIKANFKKRIEEKIKEFL